MSYCAFNCLCNTADKIIQTITTSKTNFILASWRIGFNKFMLLMQVVVKYLIVVAFFKKVDVILLFAAKFVFFSSEIKIP